MKAHTLGGGIGRLPVAYLAGFTHVPPRHPVAVERGGWRWNASDSASSQSAAAFGEPRKYAVPGMNRARLAVHQVPIRAGSGQGRLSSSSSATFSSAGSSFGPDWKSGGARGRGRGR